MKLSVRSIEQDTSKTYILIITDKNMTHNISITGSNPSSAIKSMVERVHYGFSETMGCLTLTPVGKNVVLTITYAGITSRYLGQLSELKFC